MEMPNTFLYLTTGDVVATGPGAFRYEPTGHLRLAGSIKSGSVKSDPTEHHGLVGDGRGGADFRLVTVAQSHNPKYGYGVFELSQLEPSSGAVVKAAKLVRASASAGSPSVRATGWKISGEEVVVFVRANVAHADETGRGVLRDDVRRLPRAFVRGRGGASRRGAPLGGAARGVKASREAGRATSPATRHPAAARKRSRRSP